MITSEFQQHGCRSVEADRAGAAPVTGVLFFVGVNVD